MLPKGRDFGGGALLTHTVTGLRYSEAHRMVQLWLLDAFTDNETAAGQGLRRIRGTGRTAGRSNPQHT